MSSTPFMQLYPGDYLADTLHLTTEQHGAYCLLLMTMWRSGAVLPNDPAKLARITRVSPKRWPSVWSEINGFFTVEGDTITNARLTKEHQKAVSISQERKNSGKKGGDAKALINNDVGLANATVLLPHLLQHSQIPELERKKEEQQEARKHVYDQVLEAASSRGQCHSNLAMGISPITDLISKGYNLESDILPVIREKAAPTIRSWSYYVTVIIQRQTDKQAVPMKAKPKVVNWTERVNAFYDEGLWPMGWGPKPGDPGCGAPPELIRNEQTRETK